MNLIKEIRGKRFVLESPLSPDECIRRLKPRVGNLLSLYGPEAVVGSVHKLEFDICKRTRFRNPYQTTIFATLVGNGNGTKIVCRSSFTLAAVISITMISALGAICILTASLLAVARILLQWHLPTIGDMIFVLFGFGMLGLVMIFAMIGRFLTGDEEPFLLQFLEATISARRV